MTLRSPRLEPSAASLSAYSLIVWTRSSGGCRRRASGAAMSKLDSSSSCGVTGCSGTDLLRGDLILLACGRSEAIIRQSAFGSAHEKARRGRAETFDLVGKIATRWGDGNADTPAAPHRGRWRS